jgi:dethiobiotin synthetase
VTDLARPARLVFVSGTATEVGKTWWTAAVARALRADGLSVAARKPVQSCAPGDVTDADVLAAATGEPVGAVTPAHRTYRLAWAPPMAAEHLGLAPFTIAELVAEISWPPGVDVGLVEGVGGPRSPVASDGDNVALAEALAPDLVLVVADAGLGAVNAARLSAAVYATHTVVVALNRYRGDALQERNRAVLEADGSSTVTSPTDVLASLSSHYSWKVTPERRGDGRGDA